MSGLFVKMKHVGLLGLLIIFSFQSCQNTSLPKDSRLIINIQPFDDLPEAYLKYVNSELKKVYDKIEINKAIPFPESCLNENKTRYRADLLLDFLSKHTPDGHLTIGLTTRDISTTKNGIKDWGVMGLGFCPGKSCIASSFRLKKEKKSIQLLKVAIHELGHTQGLPHCPVKSCFMRDAEGKNHTDEEKEFCPKCKKVLIKSGWALK